MTTPFLSSTNEHDDGNERKRMTPSNGRLTILLPRGLTYRNDKRTTTWCSLSTPQCTNESTHIDGDTLFSTKYWTKIFIQQKIVRIEFSTFLGKEIPLGIKKRKIFARQRMFFGPMGSSTVFVTDPFETVEEGSMMRMGSTVGTIGDGVDPTGRSSNTRRKIRILFGRAETNLNGEMNITMFFNRCF